MTLKLYQVDAFTNRPFSGNQAAVCLLDSPRPDEWMKSLAAEMNLAETAYILPAADGYSLRWFTPRVEEELCGHATLASAFTLWETGTLDRSQTARFHTRSGLLTARCLPSGWIELDFPSLVPLPEPAPEFLSEYLGMHPLETLRGPLDWLIRLPAEEDVRTLQPDFTGLMSLSGRGIIVTARADAGSRYDFVSRFFDPREGIPEDPVTGSAHCCLAPYWSRVLGKNRFSAYQASPRGGELDVELSGERVQLRGQAVMIYSADLNV